jgi:hypothetical protein
MDDLDSIADGPATPKSIAAFGIRQRVPASVRRAGFRKAPHPPTQGSKGLRFYACRMADDAQRDLPGLAPAVT